MRTVFKITPFIQPESLDDKLAALGYEFNDHSLVKTVHLDMVRQPSHSDICMENVPSEAWLDAVAMFSGLSEEQRTVTRTMMEQSPLSKCFAVLYDNGIPVASGLAVIEDGWVGLYDIVTDPGNRNRGFGEQLVLHLLQWGRREGATEGYLLVVKNNAPANRLYDKIGFEQQYEYWYRIQADKN
jgi:ribosomal protein S18 acetylase RimI-like enzyme